MRPFPLTVLKGGINRLRVKGAARADSLYDLLNGYLTAAGTVVPREGTTRTATLNANTSGLCAFSGKYNVFSNALQTVPSGYVCNLLIHPTNQTLFPTKIWFAKPFMGFLYVVAQFSNGDVFHYWLQSNGNWTASTVYNIGAIILPNTPNGWAYQAVRDMPPNPPWTSETTVSLGTVLEPTEATGFAYRAVAVAGTSPHTGPSEPTWPTVIGGTVQEFGDFDTNATAAATTQGSSSSSVGTLGANITDRYGDSNTIAGLNTATTGNATTTAAASTAVTTWAKGTTYAPGAVVKPSTAQGAFINAIPNGDFEAGDDGNWDKDAGWSITNNSPYQGSDNGYFSHTGSGVFYLKMHTPGAVTPGQSVTATAYAQGDSNGLMQIVLRWSNASDTFISETVGTGSGGGGTNPPNYSQVTVTGVAPAGAVKVRVAAKYSTGSSSLRAGRFDLVSWNLSTPAAVSNFLYEAVQANAGASGSSEPTWPTIAGNTVIDGGVTWKAIGTSIVTWQAIPIMQSGTVEPTWPTTLGGAIRDTSSYTTSDGHTTDTSMSWTAINRQISDTNCPNQIPTALGASHVFNGNNDICSFSAAVAPTDWTTKDNAGYLPTGLNNYGDNPIAMLALYRSNLMVFNAGGYQMYQIDPDPQNMALLDAQPVGSRWPRAAQSVANDLLLLTDVGVRNIGTVGPTANMAVGSTGQPVDPLVVAQLQAGTYDPLSLYYPGRGQYWLIFGPQALVLTINGNGSKNWSRYVFPDSITDWTLNGGALYLRTAGNLVWKLDATALQDDMGGTPTNFSGVLQWPYLDAGVIGEQKEVIGLDLVGDGSVSIQIGWREDDKTTFNDNAGFATSVNVTAPFTVAVADTLPGEPIPIPVSSPSYTVILTFGPNQAWTWQATNLYLKDTSGGGLTG